MPSDPFLPPGDMPGDANPGAPPLAPDPTVPGDPDVTGPAMPEPPGDPAGGPPSDLPANAPGDPAASGGWPEAEASPAASPLSADDDPIAAPSGDDAPDVPESAIRVAEAIIFASASPISAATLAPSLPPDCDSRAVLHALAARTAGRGVALVQVAGGWAFRTAPDLAAAVTKVIEVPRRLPRAAMEALAIIAWHQPVTRPEIEEIRGASLSQTTLEILLENGLVAPRGKKEAPGRPTLWGTTPRFLDQFGLNSLRDLPRREELLPEPGLPFGDAPAPAEPSVPAAHVEAAVADAPAAVDDAGEFGTAAPVGPGTAMATDDADAGRCFPDAA